MVDPDTYSLEILGGFGGIWEAFRPPCVKYARQIGDHFAKDRG